MGFLVRWIPLETDDIGKFTDSLLTIYLEDCTINTDDGFTVCEQTNQTRTLKKER